MTKLFSSHFFSSQCRAYRTVWQGLGVLFLLLLVACSVPKGKARLSGRFDNLGNEAVYLYTDEDIMAGVDTLRMESGRFTKDYTLSAPTLVTLLFPNFSRRYVILTPNEEVTISGDANDLIHAEIIGTEANEQITDFRSANLKKTEAEQRLAAVKFITDNPASLASLALFRMYFVDVPTTDASTARRLLKLMAQGLGKEPAYRFTQQMMERQLRTVVGEPLPAFSAPTFDGRTLTDADFKGQPLVVLCTALWNPASHAYLSEIKKIQSSVPKVRCLLISFDLGRRDLAESLQRNSIDAPTLFDGKALQSPLYETFGVRVVPEVLLVNSQGRIKARDLRADELFQAVQSLQ